MKYFKNIIIRLANNSNKINKSELFEKYTITTTASKTTSSTIGSNRSNNSTEKGKPNRYSRRGYLKLNQNDDNRRFSEIYFDNNTSSDEDLFIQQNKQMVTKGAYNMRQEFENSYEELVESKRKIKKIRIILIVLTILFFAALIAVALILVLNRSKPDKNENLNGIDLESVIYGMLTPKRFNGTWTPDNNILYTTKGQLWNYDPATKKGQPLITDHAKLNQTSLYEKSADGRYLLIARGYNKIFRHSFAALYSVIDLTTEKVYPITFNEEEVHLFLVKWAPVGNALIINYDRNLYYKSSPLDKEIQLTFDTNPSKINGHPDWVYEEEVFSSNVAVWFNPSGTKIAYIQFDDSSTPLINLPFYGIPGDTNYQYPAARSVHYPKTGASNPFVKFFQVDLKQAIEGKDDFTSEIAVPGALNPEEHIITAVEWLTNDLLLSIWMNRIQNRAYLQVSDSKTRYEVYSITSKTGWVDLFTPPAKNQDGSQIALILPQKQGDDGDYRHLSLLSIKNNANNKPIALTSGKYVVQSVLHWDYENNLIFYTANQADKSQVLHIFAVKAERGASKPQCITCNIKINGVEQTYFSAEFSPSGKYFVLTTLGPSTPKVDLYQWSYKNGNVSINLITEWESNQEINNYLSKKSLPEMEYHTVDVGDGLTAKVLLQLPPGVDRSGSKKYPMLVDVYAGPDSYAVTERWSMDWGSYLATNQSIIYARIDGRGSGLRGDKHLHSIYLKLGTLEVYDQINVTKKLQSTLPYIDESKIGIWGWSYGGYTSAMALAHDNTETFKCATSVAPVTDWLYYDSIYTERYMGLPKQNILGYEKSRLTALASKFKKKKYMLVHGTLDDNVHYQQAMMLSKTLEHKDILFRQISYPDEDHGLYNVRPHLYHSLNQFFGECFDIDMGQSSYGK